MTTKGSARPTVTLPDGERDLHRKLAEIRALTGESIGSIAARLLTSRRTVDGELAKLRAQK